MLEKKIWKGFLSASAAAALLGALSVQAQTPQPAPATPAPAKTPQTAPATPTPAPGPAGSSAPGSTASGAGAALSRADQKILMDMAMANMAEVEMGKMAQTKSQNEQVKNFAQMMIDDHTKALSEVQQLAQSKGVTLPSELDKKHKADAEKLGKMEGDAFDKTYMARAGVADHQKVHTMLAQAQKRAKDPDVKALAGKMAPTVDQHLDSAKKMHSGTAKPAAKTAQ